MKKVIGLLFIAVMAIGAAYFSLKKEEGNNDPVKSVERQRSFKDGIMFGVYMKDSSAHRVIIEDVSKYKWMNRKGDAVNWTKFYSPKHIQDIGMFGPPTIEDQEIGIKAILHFINQFPDSAGTKQENQRVIRALENHLKK
jgi:hypothetical protein